MVEKLVQVANWENKLDGAGVDDYGLVIKTAFSDQVLC